MRLHRAGCIAALIAALTSGCSPVRENRQINFSSDGKNVGFQHGAEGVFVADDRGGALRKIFTPTKDTLASSSPLFSPTDRRLIFTTAKPRDGDPQATTATNTSDPAGAIHTQRPVVYTCWLRGDKDGDRPEVLFSARCDHVGYVAANLAVRWHPKGDRILFLDGEEGRGHGVSVFDLATKAKKPAFPHRSAAIIFDWAPDNEHLVCVRGGARADDAGIWIGKPGGGDWWHVPGSQALAAGALPSTIEQLRATTPAWEKGGRFAFASHEGQKGKHLLSVGDLAKRTVTRLGESDQPSRDLRWAKDGRLGVVQGTEIRVAAGGKVGPALKTASVRQLVGWSADGQHLAYVAHDFDKEWDGWKALLLVPDPLARDQIFLAPGGADAPGRVALSGVRVTFPHWSPADNKLSFWGTFTPSHRSWLAAALGSALRPGDPAAVIDVATGELTWMPVSPAEKAQVGHYHLLKRDYAEAWRWYEQARAGEAKVGKEGERRAATEDFSFFESYCLTKLKREGEAKVKLERFRKTFAPSFANAARIGVQIQLGGRRVEEWFTELASPATLSGQLLRDLYQGEVLLSLGAAEDGEAHFRREAEAAKNDEERLSRTILLAQMLLARKKWREYGRLTAGVLLPMTAKRYDGKNLDTALFAPDSATLQQAVLVATAGVTLLPLMDRNVLDACDADDLKACLPLVEELADRSMSSLTRKDSHGLLFAVARKLGRDKERQKALEVLLKLDGRLTEETFDERARADLGGLRASLQGLVFLLAGGP